jgi:putative ABC transport system ATP-binding protein
VTAPVVEMLDVSKVYPGGVAALRDASLTIARGEQVAIVGPSGSGKSTLLHLMGTLDRPSSGRIRIAGHDVARLDDRQASVLRADHIGFVFQQFHLTAGVSALDSVADGLLYCGVPLGARRERAEQALRQVGLADRMKHRPHELSGGEQQRVAVARAIVGRPSLLLADEPTGNLDSASGAAIIELLRDLNAGGATLVVITHDQQVAGGFARRILIRDGRVQSDPAPG